MAFTISNYLWKRYLVLRILLKHLFVKIQIIQILYPKKSRSSIEYIICFEKKNNSTKEYIGKETENGDVPLLNSGNSVHNLTFPKGSIHFNIPDGFYDCSQPDRVEIITPFNIVNGTNDREVVLKGEFKWGQSMLNEEISKGTYFFVKTNKFSVRFQRAKATYMAPEKFIDNEYLIYIRIGVNRVLFQTNQCTHFPCVP